MTDAAVNAAYRRRLLRFVLQSPLLAAAWPLAGSARPELAIPDEARRALDLFQIKAAARNRLDLATWHFIVNGADDGKTMAANRADQTAVWAGEGVGGIRAIEPAAAIVERMTDDAARRLSGGGGFAIES